MTRDGVTHLRFLPLRDPFVLAVGDKKGNIALWDINQTGDLADVRISSVLHQEESVAMFMQEVTETMTRMECTSLRRTPSTSAA